MSMTEAKQSQRKSKTTDETREESRKLKAIWAARATLTQTEFGERFEIGSQGAVWQFLEGHTVISLKAARGFAAGLGCQIEEFSPRLAIEAAKNAAFASGSMDSSVTTVAIGARRVSHIKTVSQEQGPYPLVSGVQAGKWTEIVNEFQREHAEEWLHSSVDLGTRGFVLKVEGPSMTNPAGGKDNFPEGMYVHINPDIEAQPGDYVVAKREGENEGTLKKLMLINGELYLHAINPAWPTPYIKLEPGDQIVGKLKFAGWKF